MKMPTLSGMISVPLKLFTIASDSTETFSAQELVDGIAGGAVIAGVGVTIRQRSVVKKTFGEQGFERYKSNLVVGVL